MAGAGQSVAGQARLRKRSEEKNLRLRKRGLSCNGNKGEKEKNLFK